ncbi:CAP domain-containing protein [Streptomyces sioyaensis]|uniref:CAP domain-containing protein n=1 Tax=Streptomyces sioyaensis TaxID=67364 RepID=UPI0037910AB6
MTKHRRTRRYRKITVAAFAIGAVAVPSAAMACLNEPGQAGGRYHGHWQSAGYHHHWSGKHDWSGKPTAGASKAAAPSPSASKSSAPASGATAQVVKLVNAERSKAGCSPLTVNAKLTKAAQDHSQDMADHKNMSHTGSDGSDPGDRITKAGYNWSAYGENVAYGYSSPESVMQGWMTSPGHKRNILDCSFKEIGVGHAQPGDYWTQDFGAAQ